MRRTLAVVGFSWLLTLVAAAFLGFTAAIVFLVMTAAGAGAAFLVPALRKGRTVPAALLACTLALASFCLTEQFSYAPIVRLDGQTASVTGYIKNIKKCGSIIKELKFNKNFWRGSMEEDKVLHGILLKKAKEAQYTNYEIEQLNLQSESLFIRYYLEREAAKIVENTNIEEDVLKKIYEENKEL